MNAFKTYKVEKKHAIIAKTMVSWGSNLSKYQTSFYHYFKSEDVIREDDPESLNSDILSSIRYGYSTKQWIIINIKTERLAA